MKNTIYTKFLIGYLALLTILIAAIFYIVQPLVYDNILEKRGNEVYKEAYSLASRYGKYHHQVSDGSYEFVNELTNIAYTTNTIIWITDENGKLITSTQDYVSTTQVNNISDYFKDQYYAVGDLNRIFSSDYVSAASPVVYNYAVYGYVMVHYPVSLVESETVSIMNLIYIVALGLVVLSFIILIIFTICVYFPIKKINKASREYAKGNFDYNGLKIKSKDELGDLASNINYMAEEIKNIDDKQRKFISNCSHDFRSPLTSIKGYLEAMLDGTIPPEMYVKYLNIVLTEAERLNKLTSSLLTINTWNSIESGLDLTDFDMVQILRDTIASFEGQCQKKKITMDVTFGAKTYMVNADQIKIQQVIYNLIDNAIKFSNQNSTIYISVLDKNETVFVSIKDTGIGIPKKDLNKIWDRFYKSDQSRGKDKQGSGLGLSIVKEIITSHNENINVTSTEGVGTEFTFSLKKAR